MTLYAKITMSNSQRHPWNLYLIEIVEDIVVFLGLILIIPICFPAVEIIKSSLYRNHNWYIISSQNYQNWYLIHSWKDKAFEGTLVNRTLPSLTVYLHTHLGQNASGSWTACSGFRDIVSYRLVITTFGQSHSLDIVN